MPKKKQAKPLTSTEWTIIAIVAIVVMVVLVQASATKSHATGVVRNIAGSASYEGGYYSTMYGGSSGAVQYAVARDRPFYFRDRAFV